MTWVDPPTAAEVKDAKTFAAWTQASFGTPYPTLNDIKILGKKAKQLFDQYPDSNWQTLVQVAQWCRSKRRRVARVWHYVDQFRWAWQAGAVEIHPIVDEDLKEEVNQALTVETDRAWRARLHRAEGNEARREVLAEWRSARASTATTVH